MPCLTFYFIITTHISMNSHNSIQSKLEKKSKIWQWGGYEDINWYWKLTCINLIWRWELNVFVLNISYKMACRDTTSNIYHSNNGVTCLDDGGW